MSVKNGELGIMARFKRLAVACECGDALTISTDDPLLKSRLLEVFKNNHYGHEPVSLEEARKIRDKENNRFIKRERKARAQTSP